MTSIWNSHFTELSPAFACLNAVPSSHWQNFKTWPSLQHYNDLFKPRRRLLTNSNKQAIVFTDPDPNETYEARIFKRGEITTRAHNWHDFFNMLVWLNFPRSKAWLNHWHFQQSQQRAALMPRSKLENRLTHFDESGAVILCSEPDLLEALEQQLWHHLFWQQRDKIKKYFQVLVFGHAIYEKLLNPYIGLTAHAISFRVDATLLAKNLSTQRIYADKLLADFLSNGTALCTLPRLSPLPLLGLPGWWLTNESESFYFNENYFRPLSPAS